MTGPDLIEREFTAPAPVRGVNLIDAAGQTAVEREPIPRLGGRVILSSTAGEFWCHSQASAGGAASLRHGSGRSDDVSRATTTSSARGRARAAASRAGSPPAARVDHG